MCGGGILTRIRLFIHVRSDSRCRIDSVPLKLLVKLSAYKKRRWEFKDGWLILEGF